MFLFREMFWSYHPFVAILFTPQENEELKRRIEMWESERNDFDHQKKEFYEKRDNSEELQDLQKQELAKLKHMVRK